jgi:hypothetical protein
MDLFNALKALGLVKFLPEVEKFLGVFAGPLAILLNAVAIGVVFMTVIRIVVIVMSSLTAFNDAKAGTGDYNGDGVVGGPGDNSQAVLKGALVSMLMTLALALFAFVAVTQGVNILYNFATGFTNDAAGGVKVNAIEAWLGKGSIFTIIMIQVQSIAKVGVVLVGGVILARTLFSALSRSKYEEGANQYDRVQNALKRAFIVGIITVFGFFAVDQGPNQIYTLLTGFQDAGGLTNGGGTTPITTPAPGGGGATPTPAPVTPAPSTPTPAPVTPAPSTP